MKPAVQATTTSTAFIAIPTSAHVMVFPTTLESPFSLSRSGAR